MLCFRVGSGSAIMLVPGARPPVPVRPCVYQYAYINTHAYSIMQYHHYDSDNVMFVISIYLRLATAGGAWESLNAVPGEADLIINEERG